MQQEIVDSSPSKSVSPKKSASKVKNDSDSSSGDSGDELAEDSERDEAGGSGVNVIKQFETAPLNCFKDFYRVAPIYKYIDEYGSFITPLSVVGMFLNYAGNHLLHWVYTVMKRKIFYPSHKVVAI